MNSTKIILVNCAVYCALAVSTPATAQMMGHRSHTMGTPMHRPMMMGAPVRHPLMSRTPIHHASEFGMPAHHPSTMRTPTGHASRSTMNKTVRLNTASRFQRANTSRTFNHLNDGDFDADDGFRHVNEIIFVNFPFFPFFGFSFFDFPFFYWGPYYYPYVYPYSGYGDYGYQNDYGVNTSVVVQVQRLLGSDGYYSGRIDGVAGSRTRHAIRTYERNHGLPIDGEINRRLLVTMGLA